MAKATKVIRRIQPTEADKRKQDLQEIENALIENKDAIIETLELMKLVQGTELINILRALISERDEVIENVVTFLDGSDITRSLSNGMILFNTLGQLNIDEIESIVEKLNAGLTEIAHIKDKKGGYPTLLQSVTDPDVIEGLNTGLAFIKGVGSTKTEDSDVKMDQEYNRKKASSTKWFAAAAAAGASLVALSFLFKK